MSSGRTGLYSFRKPQDPGTEQENGKAFQNKFKKKKKRKKPNKKITLFSWLFSSCIYLASGNLTSAGKKPF